ncbi:MAG: NUDIX domain-containing protein [Rhodobacteraceae bacterium]|nr:NUDIX domain-containing protein [Paracoccaceae bacterium]
MSDVFICGPLMHLALLEKLLGRAVVPDDLVTAELAGRAIHDAPDQPAVIFCDQLGAVISGMVMPLVDANELASLVFYQGGYGLHPIPLPVTLANGERTEVQVFWPQEFGAAKGAPFTHRQWVAQWGDIAVAAADEIMAQIGQLTPDQIAARLPGIHIRAASYVAAQARSVGATRDLTRDIVVHKRHRKYSNFFAAEEMDLQYRRYDGEMSKVLNRGAQMLGQAAVVLPYDPDADAVLMVEQFRAPLFMGGDRDPWLWQPVAGLVDPGEPPEMAAHREVIEEAGLELSQLFPVAGVYSSPGANSDFVNLFVGIGDFSTRSAGGGLAEEGEDIKVRIVSFDDLMQGVDQGIYRDMQLVLTSLWLARHRHRWR